jgi:hypothetical protein
MKNVAIGSLAFLTFAAVSVSALADDAVTVDALLAQGYAVVGAITSQIGPGVFLQKGQDLELCFVSETPNSAAVTTRYCKPVH